MFFKLDKYFICGKIFIFHLKERYCVCIPLHFYSKKIDSKLIKKYTCIIYGLISETSYMTYNCNFYNFILIIALCHVFNLKMLFQHILNGKTTISLPSILVKRNGIHVITCAKRMADCILYMQTNICSTYLACMKKE